jgi:TatD DNase family protein
MKYVDTHCHIDMILEKGNIQNYSALKHEFPQEFEAALHISCHPLSMAAADELRLNHQEIYCAYGIHPHDAKDYTDEIHEQIISRMNQGKVVAWGEIGLDYHYDYSPRDIQKEIFKKQLIQGLSMNKPCIIHTREADDDTLDILSSTLTSEDRLHIHCFTGTRDFAQQLLALPAQIYFGFTGVITFKSAQSICEALESIPLERLLLETDSPFMAPIPFRGKLCHPGHIPMIAQKMAEVKGIELEEIFHSTRKNTKTLYGI